MQIKWTVLAAVMVMLVGAFGGAALAAEAPVTPVEDLSQVEGEVVRVDISNFAFGTPDLTVAPGTTVVWENQDAVGHNVDLYTGDTNPLESSVVAPMLNRGDSWAATFNEEGVYEYLCDPHPFMTGSVTVEA